MKDSLTALSLIICAGVLGQWIAWALRVPSILILLVFGLALGPGTGLLEPDSLFGPILPSLISLSVAFILFEGGLCLKIRELKKIGKVVVRLSTIAVVVTWVLTTIAAYALLDMPFAKSLLLGALLVVTGPTVILPLVKFVRPIHKLGAALRWEGIITDPIGAVLATLVLQAYVAHGLGSLPMVGVVGAFKTVAVGVGFSIPVGYILVYALRRYWIPDSLEVPIAVALVAGTFAVSNAIQHESGLLTVTLLGIVLGNQEAQTVRRIEEFKENIQTILLAVLFIILPARLNTETLSTLGPGSFVFALVLIFIIRPAAVYAATARTSLNFNERSFLAAVAPRGVVAAAVASFFDLEMARQGVQVGQPIAPVVFLVILFTVAIYGLSAKPLAIALGVTRAKSRGVLFLGATPLATKLSLALKSKNFPVCIIDSNLHHVIGARSQGIDSFYGNLLDEEFIQTLNLDNFDRFVALTENDEINILAATRFAREFGREKVFRAALPASGHTTSLTNMVPRGGRLLFPTGIELSAIDQAIAGRGRVEILPYREALVTPRTAEVATGKLIPMFVITKNLELIPVSRDLRAVPVGEEVVVVNLGSETT